MTGSSIALSNNLLLLLNALIFQLGWFVCVLGGSIWALLFTLPVVALHLLKFPAGHKDGVALAVALALGLLHDNLLALIGVFVFAGETQVSPPWLWCLWLLMALTFNHSLQWIYSRPWIAAVGGAIFGPLAYSAGVALSDIEWGLSPAQSVVSLVIVWLFVLPLHRYLTLVIGSICAQKNPH